MLDALCYPHIIDGVFESAALSSLLVLRRVSRAFRAKADARIGFHLRLVGNALPIEIHSGLLGERLAVITVANFGAAVRERFPWAAGAGVIDIDASAEYKELSLLLLSWELRDLRTLRFASGAPQHVHAREQLGLPRAERAVYFSADFGPAPDPLALLRHSLFFSGTVVLNCTEARAARGPGAARRHDLSPFSWATLLVVIVHAWTAPATPAFEVRGSAHAAFEGSLGDAFHVLCAAARSGLPAMLVVGLDALAPAALGLHAHELPGSVPDALRACIKERWDAERAAERAAMRQYAHAHGHGPGHDHGPDHGPGHGLGPGTALGAAALRHEKKFRFRTLSTDEYRRAIGDAEFEIETCRDVRFSRHSGARLHRQFFPGAPFL